MIYIYTQGLYKASEKGGPFDLGIACYTAIVLIVTVRLTVETSYWTWLSHMAIWGTILLYFIFGLIYSSYIWTFMGEHAGDLYWIVQVNATTQITRGAFSRWPQCHWEGASHFTLIGPVPGTISPNFIS